MEHFSDNKNLNKKANSPNDQKECQKKIFCPACGRYVLLESIIAGICKDCFKND